jgi:exonuclease III
MGSEILVKPNNQAEAQKIYSMLSTWAPTLSWRCSWSHPWKYRQARRRRKLDVHSTSTVRRNRLASWNINSLMSKKLELLEACRRMKVGILALQETRVATGQWPPTLPGFDVYRADAAADPPGARGVLLAVHRSYASSLVAMSHHWVIARVHGIEPNIPWYITSIYLPHDRATKRTAVRKVKSHIDKIRAKDPAARIVVLGDLNANPTTVSRLFPLQSGLQRKAFKGSDLTYYRRKRWSALDHVLCSEQAQLRLARVRAHRSYELSDHFPITAKMKTNPSQPPDTHKWDKRAIIDIDKLPTVGMSIMSDKAWMNWWTTLQDTDPAGEAAALQLDSWANRFDNLSWAMARKHHAVKAPKRGRPPRLNKAVKNAISEKRKKWRIVRDCRAQEYLPALAQYKLACVRAREAVSTFRDSQWARYLEKGMQHFSQGDTRRFFKWVDRTTKYKGRSTHNIVPMADDDGTLQCEPGEIAKIWSRHCAQLASDPHAERQGQSWHALESLPKEPDLPGLDQDVSWAEIQHALKTSKNHKAAGASGLPAEWFKILIDPQETGQLPDGPTLPMQRVINHLIAAMWATGTVPPRWAEAVVVPILKKGDASRCDNYRGISLIEIITKILSKIVTRRLANALEAEGRLAREQAGFRKSEECMGQVAAVLEVIGRRLNANPPKPTVVIFIDFWKAYDTVPHEALFHKLERIGVTGRALNFFRGLYSNATSRVRVGTILSDATKLLRGQRQGGPESPDLFNVFINDLAVKLRVVGVDVPGLEEPVASLLFADDLVAFADNPDAVSQILTILGEWTTEWGMKVSTNKSAIMTIGNTALCEEVRHRHWLIPGYAETIPIVDKYEYLGVTLSRESFSKLPIHLDTRIEKFIKRRAQIQPFIYSKAIPLVTRIRIFKVIGLPVLLWGREVLGPSAAHVNRLETVYNDTIKKMVGSSSKNTIFSVLALRRELDIESVHELVMHARTRAYFKFPNLKTWIANLVEQPAEQRKHGWVKGTQIWLRRYPKVDLKGSAQEASGKLKEYFKTIEERSEQARALAYVNYCSSGYIGTRTYIAKGAETPRLARGINWLTRARVGAIWTTKRAAQATLIPRDWGDKCPACEGEIDVPEMEHVILNCPTYSKERDDLSPLWRHDIMMGRTDAEKVVLLLGGTVKRQDGEPLGLDRQWSGDRGETLRDEAVAGYTFIAKFLQRVYGNHMRSLWSLQL